MGFLPTFKLYHNLVCRENYFYRQAGNFRTAESCYILLCNHRHRNNLKFNISSSNCHTRSDKKDILIQHMHYYSLTRWLMTAFETIIIEIITFHKERIIYRMPSYSWHSLILSRPRKTTSRHWGNFTRKLLPNCQDILAGFCLSSQKEEINCNETQTTQNQSGRMVGQKAWVSKMFFSSSLGWR